MRLFACLALVLFAGFLPFSGAVHARENAQALLEKLPVKHGNFSGSQVVAYEDPRLGVSRKYVTGNGLFVDVYLFDLGAGNVPDGIASSIVKDAYDMARADIDQVGRTGRYRDIRMVSDAPVTFQRDIQKPVTFLTVKYALQVVDQQTQQGRPVTSLLYVTGMSGYIFKVRITQFTGTSTSDDVERLMESFIEKLGS